MQWLTWVLGRLSLVRKCADGDVAARYTDKTLNDTNPNNTTPNDTTTKYLTMKSPKNRTKCLMYNVHNVRYVGSVGGALPKWEIWGKNSNALIDIFFEGR